MHQIGWDSLSSLKESSGTGRKIWKVKNAAWCNRYIRMWKICNVNYFRAKLANIRGAPFDFFWGGGMEVVVGTDLFFTHQIGWSFFFFFFFLDCTGGWKIFLLQKIPFLKLDFQMGWFLFFFLFATFSHEVLSLKGGWRFFFSPKTFFPAKTSIPLPIPWISSGAPLHQVTATLSIISGKTLMLRKI